MDRLRFDPGSTIRVRVLPCDRYRCCATGQGLETGLNVDAHIGRQRSVKETGRVGAHPDPLAGQITSRDKRHADNARLGGRDLTLIAGDRRRQHTPSRHCSTAECS